MRLVFQQSSVPPMPSPLAYWEFCCYFVSPGAPVICASEAATAGAKALGDDLRVMPQSGLGIRMPEVTLHVLDGTATTTLWR